MSPNWGPSEEKSKLDLSNLKLHPSKTSLLSAMEKIVRFFNISLLKDFVNVILIEIFDDLGSISRAAFFQAQVERLFSKALHSELFTALSGWFSSQDEFFVISKVRV